jgi:hypothetical protein
MNTVTPTPLTRLTKLGKTHFNLQGSSLNKKSLSLVG